MTNQEFLRAPKTPLNDAQMEAVNHTFGPALVLAGAGSGKTRVITTRAARLVTEGHASPDSVLCVTFTNKAANEMRQRISSILDVSADAMWVSTFHAACLRILKSEHAHAGYERMPVIFDATDQKSLVKGILKEMGVPDTDFPYRKVMGVISRFKNEMKGPEEMAGDIYLRGAKILSQAYYQYQERLKSNNAVDFDDLLTLCISIFENRDDVLEAYRARFKFIMVDEFQDTNSAQYRFIKLLTGAEGNLFAVGDDDQSIYRWRGAKVGNIFDFERDFRGTRVILLEENYRSAGNILNAAGSVVREIGGRKEKKLWTKQKAGDPVTLYVADDGMDEAHFVAYEIMSAAKKGAAYGDFAVFYRTNAQSRTIEEAFTSWKIPYRVYGGLKFYERKEIKDVLSWLRLAVNENDDLSFRRAISSPPRGVGATSLAKLASYAASRRVSLLSAARAEDNGIGASAKKELLNFAAVVSHIGEMAGASNASALIKYAVENTGYLNFLEEKKTAQDVARAENLMELASAAEDDAAIGDFLDRITLASESDLVEEGMGTVSIMTLHVSKGLEFPVVFMVGMEDGLLPHKNSMDKIEEMNEERRLCYVGMTRAMRKLYLSRALNRNLFGSWNRGVPSIFLSSIPDDVLEKKKSVNVGRTHTQGFSRNSRW
ncbi:MAG: UvrD-helicase domain-containing protein [Nitrospinae bacterium]|nr:UvrD-helicase domain-containing protein [Nitrospinota bacterium]